MKYSELCQCPYCKATRDGRAKQEPKENSCTDGVTEPLVSATEVRAAIDVVRDHLDGHEVMAQKLIQVRKVLDEAAKNQNWIMYVP